MSENDIYSLTFIMYLGEFVDSKICFDTLFTLNRSIPQKEKIRGNQLSVLEYSNRLNFCL